MADTDNLNLLLAEIDLLKAELHLQSPEMDQGLQQKLDIACTHNSLRLEGYSLDLAETSMVIQNGLMLPGKPMTDNLTALNHYQAIKFIREQADEQNLLALNLLQKLHIMLCRGLQPQADGAYRQHPAALINNEAAPTPEHLPRLLTDNLHWLNLEGSFLHPVIFAAEAHLRLLAIQPFENNNGLCARLIMNLILLGEGFPLINIASDSATHKTYINTFDTAQHSDMHLQWHSFIAEQVMLNCQNLLNRLQQIQSEV